MSGRSPQKQAEHAITKLLPYLRIKRYQGMLAVRLSKLRSKYRGGKRRWDKNLDAKCMRVYAKIKARCAQLNQRGVQNSTHIRKSA
jgi:hypothetical protein